MSSEPRLSTTELSVDDRSEPKMHTSERTHAILSHMATVIGRKWHPVVLFCLLRDGSLGFSELESEIDGISSKVLSQTLDDLEERELVDRTVISTKPFRVEYSLTEAGRALEPVLTTMAEWGREHLETSRNRTGDR